MAIQMVSHVNEAIEQKNRAIERAMEKIGLVAERYAKEKCPVDTGRLRNSISHQSDEKTAKIGTNVEYAPYVEFGTGRGMKPHPYLRPAITNHISEYKGILLDELKS